MKYNFYDKDNVRRELKRVIQLLNNFIEEHHRMPSKFTGDNYEFDLNRRWNKFSDPETLTEEEKEYIKNNLANKDGFNKTTYIRVIVKNFVKDLKEFVKLNKRMPSTKYESEKHFFTDWIEFSKPNGLSDSERRYIESHVNVNLTMRKFVVDFVRAFNNFVLTNKRMPTQENGAEEASLYRTWLKIKKKDGISSIEYEYIIKNLVLLKVSTHDIADNEGIRPEFKRYVSEYNEFVEKYKREPSASFKDKGERSLYAKHLRYFKRGEVSNLEKEYLKKYLKKIEIRQIVIDPVQNYNNFINKYGCKPKRDGKLEDENKIYNDIILLLKRTDLTNEEKEFINDELNRLFYVRDSVIEFIKDFKEFVKTYNREPLSTITEDNSERNLALRAYTYRTGRRKLSKHDIDYLRFNGFEMKNVNADLQQ